MLPERDNPFRNLARWLKFASAIFNDPKVLEASDTLLVEFDRAINANLELAPSSVAESRMLTVGTTQSQSTLDLLYDEERSGCKDRQLCEDMAAGGLCHCWNRACARLDVLVKPSEVLP